MPRTHWSQIFSGIAQGLDAAQEKKLKDNIEKRHLKLLEDQFAHASGMKELETINAEKHKNIQDMLDLAKADLERKKYEPYTSPTQGPPTAEGVAPEAIPILLGQLNQSVPEDVRNAFGNQPLSPALMETLRPLMQTNISQEGALTRTGMQQEGATSRAEFSANSALERALAIIQARDKADTGGGIDLNSYLDTSRSGIQFVRISKNLTKPNQDLLDQKARAAGYPVVGDREDNALGLVNEAKDNIDSISSSILAQLPSGAMDRLFGKGVANTVADVLQTNASIPSFKSYRTAAINVIQAIAGLGKGLRINQAEINAALAYDIPTIRDTRDVAVMKLANLSSMLNNVERAALGQKAETKVTIPMIAKNGVIYQIPYDKINEALSDKDEPLKLYNPASRKKKKDEWVFSNE